MRNAFHHRGRGDHRVSASKQARSFAITGHMANFHQPALAAISFLLASLFIFSAECKAQDNPILKIDDDITRFAYSAGGRIAYATRHVFSVKKIDLQRDDIWIYEPDGKKHRILDGQKFVRGKEPFSYTVHSIRWSPDGAKLTIELSTSEMINERGQTSEGVSTLLLDDSGREITIAAKDSLIPGASDCSWMADGTTVVCLFEAQPLTKPPASQQRQEQQPKLDPTFILARVTLMSGPETSIFAGRKYRAFAWNTARGDGVGIELVGNPAIEPASPAGPIKLVAIDPARATSRDLGILEGYAGGLSVSPSGKKAAYWIDNGQLEVRDVEAPGRAARLVVPLGTLAWSGDENRVMVKRGTEARTGGLVWFNVPLLANAAVGAAPRSEEVPPQSVLHDLGFRLFDISPNGKSVAVVEPGRHNLLVYPIS